MNKLVINILVALILSIVALSTRAQVTLGFPGEEAATVGIYIKELATDRVVTANDAQRAIAPASVMKCVTAATAMCLLDSTFRFSTPVYLYGRRNGSTWDGNLVIASCGDPTIDSSLFPDFKPFADEIVSALGSLGIKQITGRIIIDETLSDPGCPPEWLIEDVAWEYGAGLFGFNFRDNAMTVWPSSGRTDPASPGFKVDAIVTEGSTDMQRGIGSDLLTIYSRNASNPKWSIVASMPNPSLSFRVVLGSRLSAAGIKLGNKEIADNSTRQVVIEHRSASLDEMLRLTMVHSHNLFAEGMLRAIAPGENRAAAIDTLRRTWANRGISLRYCRITDGSGLSRKDILQPVSLAAVLEYMAGQPDLVKRYVNLFPAAGKEGTVKRLLQDSSLAGSFVLKSGSMGGVLCYAGYKIDQSGMPTHVVVIMTSGFTCSASSVRESIDIFLNTTFGGTKITPKSTKGKSKRKRR